MRLTAICNEQKRTISASDGFGLLQMVPELDNGQCASEDVGPQGDGLWEPISVGERNETFLIRVWTISVSGGLELLQIVPEPDTEWCVSENTGPPRGGL